MIKECKYIVLSFEHSIRPQTLEDVRTLLDRTPGLQSIGAAYQADVIDADQLHLVTVTKWSMS